MKKMTRREICVGLSALAATGACLEAQTASAPAASDVLAKSRVFPLEQMPVRKMANGGESRDVLHGVLPTGEVIAVHESEQPAGTTPNPPHTIQHTEVILVTQGIVVFEHDGKSEKLGAGGVVFVAPGTLHSLRNVGENTAKYSVIQIGGDIKR